MGRRIAGGEPNAGSVLGKRSEASMERISRPPNQLLIPNLRSSTSELKLLIVLLCMALHSASYCRMDEKGLKISGTWEPIPGVLVGKYTLVPTV